MNQSQDEQETDMAVGRPTRQRPCFSPLKAKSSAKEVDKEIDVENFVSEGEPDVDDEEIELQEQLQNLEKKRDELSVHQYRKNRAAR